MKLFLQSERRVLGFILSLVPNLSDAEDLLQETFSIKRHVSLREIDFNSLHATRLVNHAACCT